MPLVPDDHGDPLHHEQPVGLHSIQSARARRVFGRRKRLAKLATLAPVSQSAARAGWELQHPAARRAIFFEYGSDRRGDEQPWTLIPCAASEFAAASAAGSDPPMNAEQRRPAIPIEAATMISNSSTRVGSIDLRHRPRSCDTFASASGVGANVPPLSRCFEIARRSVGRQVQQGFHLYRW